MSVDNMKIRNILRAVMVAVSFVIILLYIGPVITVGEVNIGTLTGFGIAFILIIYSALFDRINSFIKNLHIKKSGRILIRAVSVVLCFCIAVGGTTFGLILSKCDRDNAPNDVGVVLGCQVNGENPGHFLRIRINAAYDFLNENENAIAILSGGQGNGESISEAQCMKNSLVEMGIDSSRLYIEDKSTSTRENFKNSMDLMRRCNINTNRITVITNDFHEYRASKLAEKCGFECTCYSGKTPWNGFMPFATREIYAVIAQVYFGG